MRLRIENRFVGIPAALASASPPPRNLNCGWKIGVRPMTAKHLSAEKRNFEKTKMKEEPTMLMKTKDHFWEPTMSMKINDLSGKIHDLYENK